MPQRVAERSKITTHGEQSVAVYLLFCESFFLKERSPGTAGFVNCWSNHDMGNRCRYYRKAAFRSSQKSDEVQEMCVCYPKVKQGESRKRRDKIHCSLMSSFPLSVNLCQTRLKKISIWSYNKSKQITAWDFIFRRGDTPVICKNTYGNFEGV